MTCKAKTAILATLRQELPLATIQTSTGWDQVRFRRLEHVLRITVVAPTFVGSGSMLHVGPRSPRMIASKKAFSDALAFDGRFKAVNQHLGSNPHRIEKQD